MESYGQKITVSWWRLALLALIFGVGFFSLASSLHRVQVEEVDRFSHDLRRQSIRRKQEPGARGRIFDRHGVCLAETKPSFCIAINVAELRRPGNWTNTINAVDAEIDRIAKFLDIPRTISHQTVSNHVLRALPMPLLVWRNLSHETVARLAESPVNFAGADIHIQPERVYPYGSLAAHVLGYVRRDRPKPLPGDVVHFYLPEQVGRSGLEAQYNELLTGSSGEKLIQVDSRGYKHDEIQGEKHVAPGHDLQLTLDLKIQRAVERALRGWRGAGVVLDPRNGEVLALASAPSYDLNSFVPILSPSVWKKLSTSPDKPLLNRAVQGRYAPGSTFKPVTAISALMKGYSPDAEYDCTGVFTLAGLHLRCWNTYGHGEISMRKALEQSCNCYFCNLGGIIGYNAIYDQAKKLGLGAATGIDLPNESPGLLPTDEWKQRRLKDKWRTGDTCQLAIGQGMLLTTPLQMAVVTAALANRGTVYRPHLNLADPPVRVRSLDWPTWKIELVRAGMLDVATFGTGRRVQTGGLKIAAKTGTAEVDRGGRRRKNTWVTAFAPYDAPTAAVVMMVEDGESGGLTVAPMVHAVMAAIFGETGSAAETHPDEKQPENEPAPANGTDGEAEARNA
ncbi:MAG: penicillin-binding protein 2 [Kiritimatiellae bacterium]|nr:penicillin-binding protein 2 [Kiritimatiellia bacterium]